MKRRDNVFNETQVANVESNQFDLSHTKKWTGNMGELLPTACIECVPGDDFNISWVQMLRMMPLLAPVMHKVRVFTEWFFVPNRILWSNWESFITGVGTPPAHPYIRLDDEFAKGTIGDYLGIPPGDYSDEPINLNAFQIAAIFLIYDEWYRDQNVIDEKFVPLVDGSNNTAYFNFLNGEPLRRAWERDLFTSALPTTQQGLNGIELPLAASGTVILDPAGVSPNSIKKATDHTVAADGNLTIDTAFLDSSTADGHLVIDPNGQWKVDMDTNAASINDLREAWALQTFLERSIRGGLRYFEQLWAHFKTKSPDSRLQRPEFIGRSEGVMTISEVLATAQSSDDGATAEIPVGEMAGHGIHVGGRDGLRYSCLEHGFIIGITSLRPDTAYQDGLHKSFDKVDRFDYMWPDFAHIGEEEVKIREIQSVLGSSGGSPDAIFGYQPRYYAYRYLPDSVAGDFRDSLAYWTLGRRFTDPNQPPTLSEEFIQCEPRTDIFAVTDGNVDHIVGQTIHKITVNRKLPRFGVPATIV